MPLIKPNLNYEQLELDLGEDFELVDDSEITLSLQERNARSEAARGIFFQLIKGKKREWQNIHPGAVLPEGGDLPEWIDTFLGLLNQLWPWRQAAYIAWAASPKENRWPDNQDGLAREILGLSSDRVISTWRKKNPAIETAIGMLQSAQVFEHRGDVIDALVKSAKNPDYKHHQDRKLFLEMTGDHIPVAQIKALIASGQLKTKSDISQLSDQELVQLAGGDLSMLGLDDGDEEQGDESEDGE